MSLVGFGSVIGLMLAAGASRLLVRLLFGVPPIDRSLSAGPPCCSWRSGWRHATFPSSAPRKSRRWRPSGTS